MHNLSQSLSGILFCRVVNPYENPIRVYIYEAGIPRGTLHLLLMSPLYCLLFYSSAAWSAVCGSAADWQTLSSPQLCDLTGRGVTDSQSVEDEAPAQTQPLCHPTRPPPELLHLNNILTLALAFLMAALRIHDTLAANYRQVDTHRDQDHWSSHVGFGGEKEKKNIIYAAIPLWENAVVRCVYANEAALLE